MPLKNEDIKATSQTKNEKADSLLQRIRALQVTANDLSDEISEFEHSMNLLGSMFSNKDITREAERTIKGTIQNAVKEHDSEMFNIAKKYIEKNSSWLVILFDDQILFDLAAKHHERESDVYQFLLLQTARLYLKLERSESLPDNTLPLARIQLSDHFEKIKMVAECIEIEENLARSTKDSYSDLEQLQVGIQIASFAGVKPIIGLNPGLLTVTKGNIPIPAIYAYQMIPSFLNGIHKEIARFLHNETKILFERLTTLEKETGYKSPLLNNLKNFASTLDEIDEKCETYLSQDFFEAIKANNFEKVRKYIFHSRKFLLYKSSEGMPLEIAEKLGEKGEELFQFLLPHSVELLIYYAENNLVNEIMPFCTSPHYQTMKEIAQKTYADRKSKYINNNNNEKASLDVFFEKLDRQLEKKSVVDGKIEEATQLLEAMKAEKFSVVKELINTNKDLLGSLFTIGKTKELPCVYAYLNFIKGKWPNQNANDIYRFLLSETLIFKQKLENKNNLNVEEKALLKIMRGNNGLINHTIIPEIKSYSDEVFIEAIQKNNLEKVRVMHIIDSERLIKKPAQNAYHFALDIASKKPGKSSETYAYLLDETADKLVKAVTANLTARRNEESNHAYIFFQLFSYLQNFKSVFEKAKENFQKPNNQFKYGNFLESFQLVFKHCHNYLCSYSSLAEFKVRFDQQVAWKLHSNYVKIVHAKIQSLSENKDWDNLTKTMHLIRYLKLMSYSINDRTSFSQIETMVENFTKNQLLISLELLETYANANDEELEKEIHSYLETSVERGSLARLNLHNEIRTNKLPVTPEELQAKSDNLFGL